MWCLLLFPLFIALGIQAIRKSRHRVGSLLEGAIIIIIIIIIIILIITQVGLPWECPSFGVYSLMLGTPV